MNCRKLDGVLSQPTLILPLGDMLPLAQQFLFHPQAPFIGIIQKPLLLLFILLLLLIAQVMASAVAPLVLPDIH